MIDFPALFYPIYILHREEALTANLSINFTIALQARMSRRASGSLAVP